MEGGRFEEHSTNTLMCHFQVIAAEGEQKASRALREAAEVISESPSALQVVNKRKDFGWSLAKWAISYFDANLVGTTT